LEQSFMPTAGVPCWRQLAHSD